MIVINKLIEKFKQGSIYAITSRVGVGKTHFCLNLLSHIAENNGEILFLTDSLEISEIDDYITQMPPTSQNRVCFKQTFRLHKDRLKAYLREKEYTHLILDPFDIYAYDIDIGELKEIAMKNNMVVIITKSLSRPPLFSKRKHPVLSDIKFVDKRVQRKFIAYIDIILFLEINPHTSRFRALVGKDVNGEIGYTIEIGEQTYGSKSTKRQ